MFLTFTKKHIGFLLFTLLYFLFAFFSYKDFAITFDEEYRYQRGAEWRDYLFGSNILDKSDRSRDTQLFKDPDSYYIYPLVLNILNPSFSYEYFHLINLLFSFTVFLILYVGIYLSIKRPFTALLAPIILFLSLNYSGHLAANPIDIPFSIFYTLAIFLMFLSNRCWDESKSEHDGGDKGKKNNKNTDRKKYYLGITLGIVFGLAICIRFIGYSLFLIYGIYSLFKILNDHKLLKDTLIQLLIVFVVSHLIIVFIWAGLGVNYLSSLLNMLSLNTRFSYFDDLIFYKGMFFTKETRPWDYLFVYFVLTTSILLLMLFSFSLAFFKSLKKYSLYIFCVLALVINVLLYLFLKPYIYNGMRHFLYLIPLVVMCGVLFINEFSIKLKSNYKIIFFLTIFTYLILLVFNLVKLYPHQYIYFNEIAGGVKNAYLRYDSDYWGTTYKDAVAYVLSSSDIKKDNLKVYTCSVPSAVKNYSKGIFLVVDNIEDANLIICDNVRLAHIKFDGTLIKVFTYDGAKLNFIFKSN